MSTAARKLILYGVELSPPVRAVLLTLKALDLDYEFREVNVAAGEHLAADYVKKNPQHTVPMLEDGCNDCAGEAERLYICDSHAICAYLVRRYASAAGSDLYPKDAYRRAVVDQRLHYETGVLFYTCLKQIHALFSQENFTEIPKEKIAQLYDAYGMLESFLDDNDYMAGGKLTIADFSIVSTVSSFHLCYAPVDGTKHPKLLAWLQRMASLPYYESANLVGVRALVERLKGRLPKQFDKLWQKAFEDIKSGKQTASGDA